MLAIPLVHVLAWSTLTKGLAQVYSYITFHIILYIFIFFIIQVIIHYIKCSQLPFIFFKKYLFLYSLNQVLLSP